MVIIVVVIFELLSLLYWQKAKSGILAFLKALVWSPCRKADEPLTGPP